MISIPFVFILLMIVATIGLGMYATNKSKSASDFFVAGRSVSVFWNASAISGEYLSAASFMGIAGLVMKSGYDALWYPVGYATGYLFLLLFIAGPLRRFGAYTIPDFAEGRFDSPLFRKIAVIFVLFIGLFYTMPQMKGAGTVMTSILGWPYWAGIVVVGVVITFNVAKGGMKGITFVQAFQYWVKMFAISVPIFVLFAIFGGYGNNLGVILEEPNTVPTVRDATSIKFKGKQDYPANIASFSTVGPSTLTFPNGAKIVKISTVRKALPGEDPIPESLAPAYNGTLNDAEKTKVVVFQPGESYTVKPYVVTKNHLVVKKDGKSVRTALKIEFAEKTTGILSLNSPVPNSPPNQKWSEPFGALTSKYQNPLLYTYSLIIALVCGTAGLPHILVRFYTNPDGRSAKRTTLWVMVLIGAFYLFPAMWGVLGRNFLPSLYANNTTDRVVIELPLILIHPLLGKILSGITCAGAFAAFMSTFSGLLVSMSGALAHDVYGKIIKPNAKPEELLKAFKYAAVIFGVLSILLGLTIETFDITMLVGWAFAIAAASYFPLLLLGAWWRGLTMRGAATGMLTGGLLSLSAIICNMLIDKKILQIEISPLMHTLIEQPAIWGVPLALITMFVVSKLTASSIPADVDMKMLRLHAPEEMGLSKNYIEN